MNNSCSTVWIKIWLCLQVNYNCPTLNHDPSCVRARATTVLCLSVRHQSLLVSCVSRSRTLSYSEFWCRTFKVLLLISRLMSYTCVDSPKQPRRQLSYCKFAAGSNRSNATVSQFAIVEKYQQFATSWRGNQPKVMNSCKTWRRTQGFSLTLPRPSSLC